MNSVKFFSIILFLLPLSLIFSIFIADFLIVVSSIFFLFFLIINKKFEFFKNDFFIISTTLCIYYIFLSLNSENVFLSLESSLFLIRFVIFTLFIFFLKNTDIKLLKYLFFGILFSFIILIVDSFYQFYFGFNLLGHSYNGLELKSLFNDKRLGSYLFRFLPIFLGLFYLLYDRPIKKYYIFLIIILIFLIQILIIFSGERVAIFFMILFNFLFLILNYKIRKYLIHSFILLSLLIFSIILFNPNLKNHIFDRTFSQILSKEKIYIFSYEHEAHYISAYKMFKQNPILGVGPKMFRDLCDDERYSITISATENSCTTHPHNFYMQLLSETGIFSFLFFLFIFIYLNKLFINIICKKNLIYTDKSRILFLISIYMSLWPFIPSGNIFNNWINIIYVLPLGFLINIKTQNIFKFFFR